MARRKKKAEDTVEKIAGEVVTEEPWTDEEQRERERARDEALAIYGNQKYGTSHLSYTTGQILRNRAHHRGTEEKHYQSRATLAGWVDAYFITAFQDQENGVKTILDIELLADFLGLTRNTLLRWARGEDRPDLTATVQIGLNEIAAAKKQDALKGSGNTVAILADLNNNHGYIQNQRTSDVNVNVQVKRELPSLEQLKEQLKLLP